MPDSVEGLFDIQGSRGIFLIKFLVGVQVVCMYSIIFSVDRPGLKPYYVGFFLNMF